MPNLRVLYVPDNRLLTCLLAMTFVVPAMAEPPPWSKAMGAYLLSNADPKEVPRVVRYRTTVQPESADYTPWLMRFTYRPNRPFMVVFDERTGKACQVVEPGDCTATPPSVPRSKVL